MLSHIGSFHQGNFSISATSGGLLVHQCLGIFTVLYSLILIIGSLLVGDVNRVEIEIGCVVAESNTLKLQKPAAALSET
jgi:hypothetical protein